MPIDITMPALSPTMETGTLAKWLVKVGDPVKSGDILCEIETDKATMEVESIDEGTVADLLVADGTEDIKVGAVIARLRGEGEAGGPSDPPRHGEGDHRPSAMVEGGTSERPTRDPSATAAAAQPQPAAAAPGSAGPALQSPAPSTIAKSDGPPPRAGEDQAARLTASPLARRLAAAAKLDLAGVAGSGPRGRIVKADVDAALARPAAAPAGGAGARPAMATGGAAAAASPSRDGTAAGPAAMPTPGALPPPPGVPMEAVKLSNMRRTIARRLAESKATVPHFYLTVDVRLDALLKLRADLNKSLEATGIKLSVNDLLIKALGVALTHVPDANVQFAGTELYRFGRADVSVAVAIPGGLITPVIVDAANKRLSVIASEMKDLAARAKDGKLKPEEYQGGTASISNLGMFGIKQFDAVINPPQGLILAVGAGEPRPYVVDNAVVIATVMSATGSFDHRAIDGATGAQFMAAFKGLVENPLGMLA